MNLKLSSDGCLYQDEIVDLMVKSDSLLGLMANSDGNLVLDKILIKKFRNTNEGSVVWVSIGKYWRFRVKEYDMGRKARG